jgi:hypothetical protein
MKKTALTAFTIFAFLFIVGANTICLISANFFNTGNFYPTPIPPTITIHSPVNNTVLNSSNASLSFTLDLPAIAHDTYGLWVHSSISWVGYSLDEAENITIQHKIIEYADTPQAVDFFVNVISLAEGLHNLVVSVAYSSFYPAVSNSTSPTVFEQATINFIVNAANPQVSILSIKNQTYNSKNIQLDFSISEFATWIGYGIDNQANITIAGNTTLTELSDGSHSLVVYANDTAGNIGTSEIIYFSIKEPFPTTLFAVASGASVAIVSIGLLVYFKKRKR